MLLFLVSDTSTLDHFVLELTKLQFWPKVHTGFYVMNRTINF